MTTQPPTLTDFLLARTAEDEATALYEYGRDDRDLPEPYSTLGGAFPDRVLAECEAKRRIMKMHDGGKRTETPLRIGVAWVSAKGCMCGDAPPCRTLAALALPYADHPEWREEWRP